MKTIVFYDGICSVCNYWVNWILKIDKKQFFYFSPLQSEFAQQFSIHFDYKFPKETIIVWQDHIGFLSKSDAVIYILQHIKPKSFPLKILKLFPSFLRNIGYSLFAYFRRYLSIKSCQVLSVEEKNRFLTENTHQDFMNMPKV